MKWNEMKLTSIPLRRNAVNLIHEDYARLLLRRVCERLAEVGLAFASLGSHYFGTVYYHDIGASFLNQRVGEEGFSASGRAVEQHWMVCVGEGGKGKGERGRVSWCWCWVLGAWFEVEG